MFNAYLCFFLPEPTRIVRAPEHLSANRGSVARFDCKIKHDPTLPITVTWLKNDKPLHFTWLYAIHTTVLMTLFHCAMHYHHTQFILIYLMLF